MLSRPSAVVLALLSGAAALSAQCQLTEQGTGWNGTEGYVYASTMWDPDGPGPQAQRLVIGGTFGAAGDLVCGSLCACMPNPVFAFQGGVSGGSAVVDDLAALPNGDLIVCGSFSQAGGVAANNIARWRGGAFQSLGGGINGPVHCVLALPNGDLIAGGLFSQAGGQPASNIARWNGTAWSPLGAGTDNWVYDVEVLPNGDIVAAGSFTQAGGAPAVGVAAWNGSTWQPLGGGLSGLGFHLFRDGADLIVGGTFTAAGTMIARNIARWNGAWSALGGGLGVPGGGIVFAAMRLPSGSLLVGGAFTAAGGLPARHLAAWDGTAWSEFGGGADGPVGTLTQEPNSLFVGGFFRRLGQSTNSAAARYAARENLLWYALTPGTDGSVDAIFSDGRGTGLIGGDFLTLGGLNRARFSGFGAASTLAFHGIDGPVHALAAVGSDYAFGGTFSAVSGQGIPGTLATNNIVLWRPMQFTVLGSGVNGDVRAIAAFGGGGNLVAGGTFSQAGGQPAANIAQWNGTSWSALGSGVDGAVRALLGSGDRLFVGGAFATAGGLASPGLAVFDRVASSWFPVGVTGGAATVDALLRLRNGDLIAGGDFAAVAGVPCANLARWNGAFWSPLGAGTNGRVRALTQLPDGDLVVGGEFAQAGGLPIAGLARWNGSAWTALASAPNGPVHALAWTGEALLVGGSFTRIGSRVIPGFARIVTPCAMSASTFPGGCLPPGVPGAAVLQDPWLRGTFEFEAFNLPPSSLVATVFGTQFGGPLLSALLPFAAPSCFLGFSSPTVVQLAVPVGGRASWVQPIPNVAALVGADFLCQHVVLELNAALQFTRAVTTAFAHATIGEF